MKYFCSIVLIGCPSTGKGTVAQSFSNLFCHPIIATGDIYKILREEDSKLGERVRKSLEGGGLCDDRLTTTLILDQTRKHFGVGNQGIIIDGYPRTKVQTDAVNRHFRVGVYIYLEAPYEQTEEYAINRRQCPVCNKTFSLLNIQLACQCVEPEKWLRRWDDTRELFKQRHDVQQANYVHIVNMLQKRKNFIRYDVINQGLPGLVDKVGSLLTLP